MKQSLPAHWPALRAEMRTALIELARLRQKISYSELAARLQTVYLHHRAPAFSALLREIAAEEEAAGRPSLAALVVNKQTGIPGAGFFKGVVMHGDDTADLEAYWRGEFNRVCDYWSEHDDE